jgi:hypothetical protein
VGFDPTISAGELPQNYALDHAATGNGIGTSVRKLIFIITAVFMSGVKEVLECPKTDCSNTDDPSLRFSGGRWVMWCCRNKSDLDKDFR